MEVGIAELVKHITKMVERAEHGQDIVITRHGKAVAKLTPTEKPREKRKFGTLKGIGRVIDPNWADPMTEEEFNKLIDEMD